MKREKSLVILNTIGFILTIILNTLAITLPINGKTTGELSDMYPNLFVPAGVTFSIWSIIYLLLLSFIIYQWVVVFGKSKGTSFINQIGSWFFISSIANSSWILAWHYVYPLISLVIMIVLFFSLAKIYMNLEIGSSAQSKPEKIFVQSCFSVYLGWITVATIANVTTVLVYYQWDGFGIDPEIWTIVMIAIASVIGIYFTWGKGDYLYTIVIIWALYGIYLKRSQAQDVPAIVWSAQIGMLANGLMMLFRLGKRLLIRRHQ